MTTELEEQFFKVFGIEKIECCKHFKYVDSKCDRPDSMERCLGCIGTNKVYPKITDRVLLEMICIANKNNIEVIGETVEEMKNKLLEEMIYWKDDMVYKQIQQLFKEEE